MILGRRLMVLQNRVDERGEDLRNVAALLADCRNYHAIEVNGLKHQSYFPLYTRR